MEQLSAWANRRATSPLPTLMTATAPSSPAVAALPERQERPLHEYLQMKGSHKEIQIQIQIILSPFEIFCFALDE